MSHPLPSFSPSAPPSYADLGAVLAGLSRMRDDLQEIAGEVAPAISAVSYAMLAPGDRKQARQALEIQQAQLVWLAADTGAMLAALAEASEEPAMPTHHVEHLETSPVTQLYGLAESLLHLGATLPEAQAGLALLLCIIGEEVKYCAESLDDQGV